MPPESPASRNDRLDSGGWPDARTSGAGCLKAPCQCRRWPRGLPVADLQAAARELGIEGASFPNVKDAIADAQKKADGKDLVLVTGSIFLVADALA